MLCNLLNASFVINPGWLDIEFGVGCFTFLLFSLQRVTVLNGKLEFVLFFKLAEGI